MNKSRIIMLIIIVFVSLFCFNMDVFADLKEETYSKDCETLKKDGTLQKKSDVIFSPKYSNNCIYYVNQKTLYGRKYCVIFQISYDPKTGDHEEQAYIPDGKFRIAGSSFIEDFEVDYLKYDADGALADNFLDDSKLNSENLKSDVMKVCPPSVAFVHVPGTTPKFVLNSSEGDNVMKRFVATDIDLNIPALIVESDPSGDVPECSEVLGEGGAALIRLVFQILRILVPVILFIWGSIDFVQAIFAQDEGAIKKSQARFIKRIIVAIIIFLIPFILKTVLGIASAIWPVVDGTLCGILD